jgi:ankyrin repeat protein
MLTLIEPGVNFRRIVFDLLVHGAEVNARSFEDITALMCACYAGDEDIVLALLNCGCDARRRGYQRTNGVELGRQSLFDYPIVAGSRSNG